MSTSAPLTDSALPVYLLKPGDHEAGADLDSFSMALHHRALVILAAAVLTGDAVLKFYAGATVGAKTTAIPFTYRLAGGEQAAASADVLGARATAVAADGVTLTAATYDNKLLAVEIAAQALPDGKPWVTGEISAAASAFNAAAIAILTPSRYSAETQLTAIA
jgi:hypothetical protein